MAITKNIIPVSVEDRFIAVSDHTQITAGNVGVDFLAVTLDAEWSGLNTYVTFSGCAQDSTTLDYAAELEVPWEQIEEAGDLYIGIQGFDPSADVSIDTEGQLVTNGVVPVLNAMAMTVPIKVRDSGAASGVAPSEPTPGTLQRVEQDLLALERSVSDASQAIENCNAAVSDAEAAVTAANSAVQQANAAVSTANSAANRANASADSADAAASSASEAAASANAAASSASESAARADASAASADSAASSANEATSAANSALDKALQVANDVSGNAAAAASSASAAAASKAASKASEDAAAGSARSASESASQANTSASGAAASAQSAEASASAAASSAKNAEDAAKRAETIAGFTIDPSPTEGSSNPVASGGVHSAIASLALTVEVQDGYMVVGIGGR